MEGMRGFVARHAGRARPRAHALRRARVRRRPRGDRARGRGDAADARLHARGARLARRVRRARRASAAPRAALGLRHRRADRAQGRLPDRRCWPRSTATRWPRTTTRRATWPRTSTSGPSPPSTAVCLEAVRSLSRRGQLPRPRDRVLAGRDRARVAVLLELLEQLAQPRARARCPSSRASSSPRTSGARRPAPRRASAGPEHGARQLEVGGDRRLGVAAAGGQPVGDREHGHLGGVGLGRPQVAPHARAGPAAPRGRGSRAAGGAGRARRRARRASPTRAAAAAPPRASSAPSRSWPGNPKRPSGRVDARPRLGRVVQQRGDPHRVAARQLVGERLAQQRGDRARRARRGPPRAGRARSRRPGRAPRACGRARRGGGTRSAPRRAARAARAAPAR